MLVLAFVAIAAPAWQASAAELSDEIITVVVKASPTRSSLTFTSWATTFRRSRLIYEPMIIADYHTLELYDTGLVTNWEQISDTHYRLTLRQGVKFHNGEELTSADILYQFQQVLLVPTLLTITVCLMWTSSGSKMITTSSSLPKNLGRRCWSS